MADANTQSQDLRNPNFMGRDSDFNRWLEQADDLLAYLEHDLRSDSLVDREGRLQWVTTGQPLLNEKGIRFIISSLRHICNKNTYMSNLDQKRVNTICLFTANSITKALFFNWREFGVSPDYYDVIIEKVNNVLELALRRGMNEGERKFLKSVEHIQRIIEQPQEQGQGGIFNIFSKR